MKTGSLLTSIGVVVAFITCGCGGGGGGGNQPQARQAVIGRTGGLLASPGGKGGVIFPKNALTTDTTVSVESVSVSGSQVLGGHGIKVSTQGRELANELSAVLVLPYSDSEIPAGAKPSDLKVYRLESDGSHTEVGDQVETANHAVIGGAPGPGTYFVKADNPYTGRYAGTYSGSVSGNTISGSWSMSIQPDGSLEVWTEDGFHGKGTVSFSGTSAVGLAGSGSFEGVTIGFSGKFTRAPDGFVSIRGSVTSSQGSGTFSGSGGGGTSEAVKAFDNCKVVCTNRGEFEATWIPCYQAWHGDYVGTYEGEETSGAMTLSEDRSFLRTGAWELMVDDAVHGQFKGRMGACVVVRYPDCEREGYKDLIGHGSAIEVAQPANSFKRRFVFLHGVGSRATRSLRGTFVKIALKDWEDFTGYVFLGSGVWNIHKAN
jgi:hypothetical protein